MLQTFMRLKPDCLEGHSEGCRPLFAAGQIEENAGPLVATIGGELGHGEAEDQFTLGVARKWGVNELGRGLDGRSCGEEVIGKRNSRGSGV